MRSDDRVLGRLSLALVRQNALTESGVARPTRNKSPGRSPAYKESSETWPTEISKEKLDNPHQDAELGFAGRPERANGETRTYLWLALLSAFGLSLFYLVARSPHLGRCGLTLQLSQDDLSGVCPQTNAIAPQKHSALLDTLEATYRTEEFRLKAYESLGGAVRVPYVRHYTSLLLIGLTRMARTVAYDDLAPPGSDARWEIFGQLHAYLENRFPLVYVHRSWYTLTLCSISTVQPRESTEDPCEQVCVSVPLARHR